MQNGAISIVFYFVAMILSLSIANIDDKMTLYGVNSTLHWGNAQVRKTQFSGQSNKKTARVCFWSENIIRVLFLAFPRPRKPLTAKNVHKKCE
jgi:hypothetical protein